MKLKSTGQRVFTLAPFPPTAPTPQTPASPMSGFAAAMNIRLMAYAAGQFCPLPSQPVPTTHKRRRSPCLDMVAFLATH